MQGRKSTGNINTLFFDLSIQPVVVIHTCDLADEEETKTGNDFVYSPPNEKVKNRSVDVVI